MSNFNSIRNPTIGSAGNPGRGSAGNPGRYSASNPYEGLVNTFGNVSQYQVNIYQTGNTNITEIIPISNSNINLYYYNQLLNECKTYFRKTSGYQIVDQHIYLIDQIGYYYASTNSFRNYYQEIANTTEQNINVFIGENRPLKNKEFAKNFFCKGINIFISCSSGSIANEYNRDEEFKTEGKKFIGFMNFVHIVGNLILNHEHETSVKPENGKRFFKFDPNIDNTNHINYGDNYILKFLNIYLKNAVHNGHKKITKTLLINKINKIKVKPQLVEKNSRITSNELSTNNIRSIKNCNTNIFRNLYQLKINKNQRIESERKSKIIRNNLFKINKIKRILLGDSYNEEENIILNRNEIKSRLELVLNATIINEIYNIFDNIFSINLDEQNINVNSTYFKNHHNDTVTLTYLNKLNKNNVNNLNITNKNNLTNIYIKVHLISEGSRNSSNENGGYENGGYENGGYENIVYEMPKEFKITFNRNNAYIQITYDQKGEVFFTQLKK